MSDEMPFSTAKSCDLSPADLMHEDEVYQKYTGLFADRELREARKAGRIRWYDLRKGPHYSDAQIMEYLIKQERPICPKNAKLDPTRGSPAESSNTKASGSPFAATPTHITSIGTNRARGAHAAEPNGSRPERGT